MKKILIVFFLLFSFNVCYAEDVSISSLSVKQGDAVLIKVNSEQKPTASFLLKPVQFFKKGNQWIGFVGVDAKLRPSLYYLKINGVKRLLRVSSAKFPTTNLSVNQKVINRGLTTSTIASYVADENAVLAKALKFFSADSLFSTSFSNPLDSINLAGAFGNYRKSGKTVLQHLGDDLVSSIGTPVYSVNNGVVRFEEEFKDFGKSLIIDHGLGIYSFYLHLDKFNYKVGDIVKKGDIVAYSGDTGYSLAPHLHFSIKLNGASVDPLKFIELSKSM